MSECDNRPKFECQSISNVKMRYSARIRMLKNEKRQAKNKKQTNSTFNQPYSLKIGTFSHFHRLLLCSRDTINQSKHCRIYLGSKQLQLALTIIHSVAVEKYFKMCLFVFFLFLLFSVIIIFILISKNNKGDT